MFILSGPISPIRSATWEVSESDLESEADDNEPLLRLPDFEVGKTGVERSHESTLRGLPGTQRVEVNVSGRTMRELALDPATPGPDMQVTSTTTCRTSCASALKGKVPPRS